MKTTTLILLGIAMLSLNAQARASRFACERQFTCQELHDGVSTKVYGLQIGVGTSKSSALVALNRLGRKTPKNYKCIKGTLVIEQAIECKDMPYENH